MPSDMRADFSFLQKTVFLDSIENSFREPDHSDTSGFTPDQRDFGHARADRAETALSELLCKQSKITGEAERAARRVPKTIGAALLLDASLIPLFFASGMQAGHLRSVSGDVVVQNSFIQSSTAKRQGVNFLVVKYHGKLCIK